jgi:serine/threonine protein kinase
MPLQPGTRLGPYEIIAPLGEGGMGQVFRARDTRLNRTVAIKTLRNEIAGDPERRARFEREARTIASLSHPHICTLHDVGDAAADGSPVAFLVMELVDGETLADRLQRGRLSLEELRTYGIQIADALDCAHRQGIVHRDLKPANIMLTKSGVKLLDFGLARLRSAQKSPVVDATRTAALTEPYLILGTLQYIAPEQLAGRDVDARADLFSFGAILYEMATGRRAFDGESQAALVAAIMQSEPPPIAATDASAPRGLDRIVSLCLAKNPDERWASAHDVGLLLKEIGRDQGHTVTRSRTLLWIPWLAAAAAFVLAASLLLTKAPAPPAPVDVLSLLPAPDTTLVPGEAPQVSPDGSHIAFVATDRAGVARLYVHDRGAFAPRLLEGTDEAMLPFWSPGSDAIGFFAGGRLKQVSLAGGAPLTLANTPVPRGGSWSRTGMIIFVPFPAQPPHIVPASGGAAKPVPVEQTSLAGRLFPNFLPDGRHYIYLDVTRRGETGTLRVGSIDSPDNSPLVQARGTATYVESGYILFRREQSLVVQSFDADRLEMRGAPITVVERAGFNPLTNQILASASASGVLAFAALAPGEQLVWFDRVGRQLGPASMPGWYNSLCLSPDGKRVVYDAADPTSDNLDLWWAPVPSGPPDRLTFNGSVDFYVVCSAAREDVAFATLRDGRPAIYRLAATAPGSEVSLQSGPPMLPTDWSRDGRFILYSRFDPKTRWDVWVLPVGGGEPSAVVATAAEERNARLSPDGQWLAYTSDASGVFEVYVQHFPATAAKWQVSRGGGQQPVWSPDGRELFYISPEKQIVGVTVTTSATLFSASSPHVRIDARVGGWERTNQGSPFAITPDGQRFLVSRETDATRPIGVILNWMKVATEGR